MSVERAPQTLPMALDGGVVMREATAKDADRLGRFSSGVYGGPGADPTAMQALAHDLLDSRRPPPRPGITLVQDAQSGCVVSTASLIPQRWSYGGEPLLVGQIETVATDPAWRRRGLVRRQMRVLHQWSDELGIPMRVIAGIPNYYHQFGYDYALRQCEGRVASGATESAGRYTLRPASEHDAPLLARLSQQANRRLLLSCRRETEQWRYEVTAHRAACLGKFDISIIEDAGRTPVGAVALTRRKLRPNAGVFLLEVAAAAAWIEVVPDVLGELRQIQEPHELLLLLGRDHPAYGACPTQLRRRWPGVSWYVSVPDIVRLLDLTRPALDRQLAESAAANVTARLRISLYGSGISLDIRAGRVTSVAAWQPDAGEPQDLALPRAQFVQLVLNFDTIASLEATNPDCVCASDRARAIVAALFPGRSSHVWQFL